MAATGASIEQIAQQIGHRFRERPRAAFRYAHGMSQQDVADAYNALADTAGAAPMDDKRISEFERWPRSRERPSVHVLDVLSRIYRTSMHSLLDKDDYDHLPEKDRRLLEREHTIPSAPFSLAVTAGSSAAAGSALASHWALGDRSVMTSEQGQSLSAAIAAIAELTQAIQAWQPAPVFGQASWVETAALPGIHQPWPQYGAVEALIEAVRKAPMDRRSFTVLTGAGLTGLAVDWTSIDPGKIAAVAQGGQVDGEFVTWFENRIPALRRIDDRRGGADLQNVVHAELSFVTTLLKKSSFSGEETARRLYAVAGELAQVAGWAAFDAGLHAAAQHYWHAALRAAHTAEDRPLGALILVCLGEQAARVGDPRDAVVLAEHAVTGAKDVATATTQAMLKGRLAFTYAKASQPSECEQALDQARNAFADADPDTDPPWVYWFDEARLPEFAGRCYLQLGNSHLAVSTLTDALGKCNESYVRDRVQFLVWLGQAELLRGEVEQAAQYGQRALALTPTISSAETMRHLSALRNQLTPHIKSISAARDFTEQYTTLGLT